MRSGPVRRAQLRDQASRERDTAAAVRDARGARRDEAGDKRDRAAGEREALHRRLAGDIDTDVARLLQAAESDRQHAHVDRIAAAKDRADATTDRQQAHVDRMAAARDRRQASLDGLTGAYNRQAGLQQLTRDLLRPPRSGHQVVVAFLDVDHLKTINDTQGHAAGDHALIAAADTLRAALRPCDLIIRYGGDEFLCATEGVDVHTARLRFARINHMLDTAVPGLSVTVGLAELETGESPEAAIARADADLYQQRKHRR